MSDLIQYLRSTASDYTNPILFTAGVGNRLREAADRIEELEIRNERLAQENALMRLESKYLVDLHDRFPMILDFVQIDKDLDEYEKLKNNLGGVVIKCTRSNTVTSAYASNQMEREMYSSNSPTRLDPPMKLKYLLN